MTKSSVIYKIAYNYHEVFLCVLLLCFDFNMTFKRKMEKAYRLHLTYSAVNASLNGLI